MAKDLWTRLKNGDYIYPDDPDYYEYDNKLIECSKKIMEYNCKWRCRDDMRDLLSMIVGYKVDAGTNILAPFNCDLGFNIILGKNILVNYKCTFLDTATINIGDNVMIGPNCKLVTAIHSKIPEERRDKSVAGKPISIENDVWIGAGVTIIPGITVGEGSIVGAGSVVTKNIPPRSIVGGNPTNPLH